jgi:tetratricopeptide (TPR) repeat protein
MAGMVNRTIASLIVLAIFFAWVYAALLPWRAERLARAVATGGAPADAALGLPWAGEPALVAARRLMLQPGGGGESAGRLLERAVLVRPLYAPGWMDLAELNLELGHHEKAQRYAELAREIWPTRGRLLWKLAMLQVRMGNADQVLGLMRDYLAAVPRDVYRTLVLARRLQPDPEALIAALMPRAGGDERRDALLRRMLDSARWLGDAALAQAVWRRLPVAMIRDPAIAYPYVDAMVRWRRPQAAIDAWRSVRGEVRLGVLENGGFERPLLNGGFGWRNGKVKGASWARDSEERFSGHYSLRVEFDGTENVNYRHLVQTVPVEPGRTYRLTGFWRGENITTRPGVFVEVYSVGGQKNSGARTQTRRQTWDWSGFSLELAVPPDAHFLAIRLRRNRTDALDNLIAGRVWLDALELTPISGEPDIAEH